MKEKARELEINYFDGNCFAWRGRPQVQVITEFIHSVQCAWLSIRLMIITVLKIAHRSPQGKLFVQYSEQKFQLSNFIVNNSIMIYLSKDRKSTRLNSSH